MRVLGQIGALAFLAVGVAHGQALLEAARFAAADLDQDGVLEVVLAGRIGPYRSGMGRGAVQVGTPDRGIIWILGDAGDLPVVRDVGIGDFGGDGHLDVFTVGAGWLQVHQYGSGNLNLIARTQLQSDWTDRVAILGGQGWTLVAVTEYTVQPDRDVGSTIVRGFDCRGGAFVEVWTLQVAAHVGDLVLLGEGPGTYLILETGAGDEGGDVLVYDVSESPTRVWGARLTGGGRCLTIEVADSERGEILFQTTAGTSRVYRFESGELHWERDLQIGHRGGVAPVVTLGGGVRNLGLVLPGTRWSYRHLTF
jgi:hypothetical protein